MIKAIQQLPKDKKQKVLLTVVMLVIGLVVLANFFVMPKLNAMGMAADNILDLETKISQEETRAKQEAGNSVLRAQYEALIDNQEAHLISGDPFSWVVRQMSLLSEGQAVKLAGLRPGTVAEHGRVAKFEVFTVQFDLTGSFDEIGNFVSLIENRFPTAEIQSIIFQAGAVGSKEIRASLDMRFLMERELDENKPSKESAS